VNFIDKIKKQTFNIIFRPSFECVLLFPILAEITPILKYAVSWTFER